MLCIYLPIGYNTMLEHQTEILDKFRPDVNSPWSLPASNIYGRGVVRHRAIQEDVPIFAASPKAHYLALEAGSRWCQPNNKEHPGTS